VAVTMVQEMDVPFETYWDVSERAAVDTDPPEGLIAHTAARTEGGGVRIVDVWESAEAYQRFRDERLMPAVRDVVGDAGAGPPEQEFAEVDHLVRGPLGPVPHSR
jgi:hypothetical protein